MVCMPQRFGPLTNASLRGRSKVNAGVRCSQEAAVVVGEASFEIARGRRPPPTNPRQDVLCLQYVCSRRVSLGKIDITLMGVWVCLCLRGGFVRGVQNVLFDEGRGGKVGFGPPACQSRHRRRGDYPRPNGFLGGGGDSFLVGERHGERGAGRPSMHLPMLEGPFRDKSRILLPIEYRRVSPRLTESRSKR